MWKLSPHELQQFKGGGGERFAHFVDRLIRAEAAKGGLPQSEVRTQIRVNIKDGGVDTQLTQAIPRDQSGWFSVPTCWQFKAVEANGIIDRRYKRKKNSLQEEINKPHAAKLITQGYGYRFCILGDVGPLKVEEWEEQLGNEARRIYAEAVAPRVIHGSDLLAWTERFFAIVAWLRNMTQEVLHWDAWERNCRDVTRTYVSNPLWEIVRGRISRHVDFNELCTGNPCLLIGGAAGVGKTRLVLETLSESAASPSLVVYATDELEARRVAAFVANTLEQTAIIVADECSYESYRIMNEMLLGHRARVRVIGLSNMIGVSWADEWLDRESIKNTTPEILAKNFESVPEDRRRQYAEFTRGFVRLAADMCLHDPEVAHGDPSGLLKSVEQYIRGRLKGNHLPLVALLALFHKIGFKGEVRPEIEALCDIVSRSRQDFVETVRIVRESPGFVIQAGRYWYVTPEIVARILFQEGWRCWVESDIAAFFELLSAELRQQLIERAAKFGGEEVRGQVASFFRGWFGRLTMRDLADPKAASVAAAIIRSSPEEYLGKLRHLIEGATTDELLQLKGDWSAGSWGPRRTLVWLLEQLVAFPEFFDDCEACLFRLALHETEHQIANSATQIWRNLFAIQLSGTAAPFERRIGLLRERAGSPGLDEARLAFRGLDRVFALPSGHVVGPPETAGRRRPDDWRPASSEEARGCYRSGLKLCGDYLAGDDGDRRALALDVLVDHLDFFLRGGFLDEIARIFATSPLEEGEVRRLVNAVDKFLELEGQVGPLRGGEPVSHWTEPIRRWIDALRPSDFDGMLRSVCAREPWDGRFAADPRTGPDDADELAAQIVREPSRLVTHLDWLASPEARSAERLGFALGRIDDDEASGAPIFQQAVRTGSAPLLRGYVRGLVFAGRRPSEQLIQLMRELEATRSQMAVDILVFGGDDFDALNRVIGLVESKSVPPRFLANFALGIGRRRLNTDELGRILPYFVDATLAGDANTAQAGLRFLYAYLRFEQVSAPQGCLGRHDVRSSAWRLVEEALPYVESRLAYEWSEIVMRLAVDDRGRAAVVLGRALLSEDLEVESQTQKRLNEMIVRDAVSVMEALGSALLDPVQGWRLQVHNLRNLVCRIPPAVVLGWVSTHGLAGARAIARHLPAPYLDDNGQAVVPDLLDEILRNYDDDQVLNNFAAGMHSGEFWWGDGSGRFRREAEDAKRFLKHPNQRIRQWAKRESDERTHMAESEERHHAEAAVPG